MSISTDDQILFHLDAVRRWCRRRSGDSHLAEDVAQDAALAALVHFSSLRDPQRLRGWLFRVAQRRLIDAARRRPPDGELVREPEAPPPWEPPPEAPRETVLRVRRALRKLPGSLRAPVRMHYLKGQPLTDVARALGTTVAGVKGRLYRARQMLKEVVE
jgi:RNA polymerase sigma-70 factor (ECF subfamily)